VDPRLKLELQNRKIQLVNYHYVSDLHKKNMSKGGKNRYMSNERTNNHD
jgi:hypothetical protein